MTGREEHTPTDPLLLPFLRAVGEAEREEQLALLVDERAGPVVRGIVASRLGRFRGEGGGGAEAEDVCQEAAAQLLARLNALRDAPDAAATIGDFVNYAAVVAHNVCHAHLRRKYPQRWQLKNKVRYLLKNQRGMALWPRGGGEWLCGLAEWGAGGATAHADLARLQPLRDDPPLLARAGLLAGDPAAAGLSELTAAVLRWARMPVELDALVTALAELRGVRDEPALAYDADLPAAQEPASSGGGRAAGAELEQREYLALLWEEVVALPVRQRAALLLNLRDVGEGVIGLLPLTGVASVRRIAEAVGMPYEQFLKLWNDLPLDDAAIAARLGLTRQQVINLRKSARVRLGRRMAALGERPRGAAR